MSKIKNEQNHITFYLKKNVNPSNHTAHYITHSYTYKNKDTKKITRLLKNLHSKDVA